MLLNFANILLHVRDGGLGEIFGRRRVLLYRIEVLDRGESLLSLLIHDLLQQRVLLLHLLNDFLLNWTQTFHVEFHLRARFERGLGRFKHQLKLVDLIQSCLFEGHAAAAPHMILEIAIVAQGNVMDFAIGQQLVFVLTHAYLFLVQWRRRPRILLLGLDPTSSSSSNARLILRVHIDLIRVLWTAIHLRRAFDHFFACCFFCFLYYFSQSVCVCLISSTFCAFLVIRWMMLFCWLVLSAEAILLCVFVFLTL